MSSYADSRIYGLEEICELLRAVDRHLDTAARVVIIGGAAAAFHRAHSTTTDVDTSEALDRKLQHALDRARAETGLDIPVGHASVADFPYNYEERLERKLAELQYLAVWVIEKHDLALSKVMRFAEHVQQLEEVHSESGLSSDVLIERFRSEMDHVTGDPVRIRRQFLGLIEYLFGEMKRLEAERLIGG